ncbi:MAG: ornithine cyclodeaminase family protein [Pseudomonadota bacterium]
MSGGTPRFFDDAAVEAATPWPALIDAIRRAFDEAGSSPPRHHHTVPADGGDITLLLMPAWQRAGAFGVKLAAVAPANARRSLPTLHGVYVLFAGDTGQPQAVLDAGALTARRTAAASALAASYLARPDARTLLVVGTGRVARQLAVAHGAVRPIAEVRIWGRNADHAEAAAREVSRATDARVVAVPELEAAVATADIVSCATASNEPLLRGRWLAPGTHVDLVGAYTPEMCEADADAVARAAAVYVDTLDGAREEAGDLLQAQAAGVFSFEAIAGDLFAMAAKNRSLRGDDADITLYKSVGTALQDLAAAELCLAG